MREQKVYLHASGPLVALVGNPNCGKTALFNLLTGSRQKVANYAGVTVERKEGLMRLASGQPLRVLDLPGTYSLYPRSEDERITCDVLMGRALGERRPQVLVCVVDATNLRKGLRLVLAVKRLGLPCIVALNMSDLAAKRGLHIDTQALSEALGLPVVSTVAVQSQGHAALNEWLENASWQTPNPEALPVTDALNHSPETDQRVVQDILRRLSLDTLLPDAVSDQLDRVLLHPLVGPLILLVVLFLIFQAVFTWAVPPMDAIKEATAWLADQAVAHLPETWWRSLLADGLIAGLGGVIVFLPQIVILFFFILLLEESGYLPRAAFLLDRIMGSVGLSGRSLLSMQVTH